MTNEEELLATFPQEFVDPPLTLDLDEDAFVAAFTARLQLIRDEVDRRMPIK